MKNRVYLLIAFALAFLLFGAVSASAQGPQPGGTRRGAPNAPLGTGARLTYQGRLTNSSGAPLNSTVNMMFKLYDSATALLWTSSTRSITPVNGLFTVYLGDGSDPNLNYITLEFAAFIGVTVGSDPEMTPRQPLNSLVGHSDNSAGVVGSSLTGIGVIAVGGGGSDIALGIQTGGIKVFYASSDGGTYSNTPVFMHEVLTASNLCSGHAYATVINNPFTNGNPDAILIVTPNYRKTDTSQSNALGPANSPVAVVYSVSGYCGAAANDNKWLIYNLNGTAMVDNTYYNVMVIVP